MPPYIARMPGIRRFLLRARSLLAPPALSVVYDEAYAACLSGVPLDPDRGGFILAFLLDCWLVRPRDVRRPRPASLDSILRVHEEAYVASLQDPATLQMIFGVPVSDGELARVVERQRLEAGGTIHATSLALATRRPAVHLGGGLHHAGPARGAGFCVFNDVAIAIRRLRSEGFAGPVLVVDLDLHHGNGTRATFAADPTVHTFSIHNADWDDTPAVATTDIALGPGVGDAAYLHALRDALPPVLAALRPKLVYYVAGTDPARDDALGNWTVTPAGMLARDRFVVEQVRAHCGATVPLVVVLAGGYGHAAWRYTARFLSWLAGGVVVEPPDEMEMTMRRFRSVVRSFDRAVVAEAARAGDGWGLTAEDLVGPEPGMARETRILGRYTPQGFELLLERLGVLPRLRALGYAAPLLDVDFGTGLGQTLRVFGEPERRHLLLELRMRRDRRTVPDREVLMVEWLLLQNPRAAFSDRLPPLPGQRYPGLGLLGVVVGLLALICEQLGLDGVAEVPSHYFVAAVGRKHLRFVAPGAQARFEALIEALRGIPLAEAERALADGRLVDAATGSVERWIPAPMVIPVSRGLSAELRGEAYESAVREARARLAFTAR